MNSDFRRLSVQIKCQLKMRFCLSRLRHVIAVGIITETKRTLKGEQLMIGKERAAMRLPHPTRIMESLKGPAAAHSAGGDNKLANRNLARFINAATPI